MHDSNRGRPGSRNQDQPPSPAGAPGGTAQRPARGGGGGGGDAPPSNTASHNCNSEYFQPLRWGVDSLYLSYPGELFPQVEGRLKALKQLAQSPEPVKQAEAQFPLAEHVFEVRDKGAPVFPYILEDGAFRIQLARPSKTVPMAYVKLSSGYLAHVGPVAAEEALRALLSKLGIIRESPNVSRIDLFVDFASAENMESWDRRAWVTRATSINSYSVDQQFSGWTVGSGGTLSARLYHKLLEIQTSGKDYLLPLWREAGWDGQLPVWRLEFQFKREVIVSLGLSKLSQVLDQLNGLWSYASTDWLRLTLPNVEDQTRSRWAIHPLWGYLSSVDWQGNGGALSRTFSPARIPGDDKLFAMGLSTLIAYMAREGITDLYQGQQAFITALYQYHENKAYHLGLPFDAYIAEKLGLKARAFNSILNNPDEEAEHKAAELRQQADAYRKASDGN